ncbi:MAG: hypothetical protein FWF38_05105 [Spirochaetaceae bacterium]|nr:hypothetical protein [Spirochaetaceae bacterium]
MKKNLLVIALICFAGLMFFACASGGKEAAGPEKDEAIALFAEVKDLRAQFLKAKPDVDETKEPYGRAKAIYDLSSIYMDKKMYAEALPGLGQAKTYYTNFLK